MTNSSTSPRRIRVAHLALLASLAVTLAALLASTPASALTNPERTYEMVSPPYKGGYGVGGLVIPINAVAPDGESLLFFSPGTFADAPGGPTGMDYFARRGASGWSTRAAMPPTALLSSLGSPDASSSLGSILANGAVGPNVIAASQEVTEGQFWSRDLNTPDTVANWELADTPLKALFKEPISLNYLGASANLCRLFLAPFGVALLPESEGGSLGDGALYELDRGCNGEPRALRLVEVRNVVLPGHHEPASFVPHCESTRLGEGANTFNAISADGQKVFFTTDTEKHCAAHSQLFVRLDGKKTLEISKPLSEAASCGEEIPCPGSAARSTAPFVGASRDGSRVFFRSSERLSETDTDGASDLYMATLGCPPAQADCEVAAWQVNSLVQVSHPPAVGEAAEVQGVVRVAPDGSRVYFVARGVLGEGANGQGQVPLKGADNLYVYDSATARTAFVADLCSGPGLSGTTEDLRCPLELVAGPVLQAGSKNDRRLWFESEANAQTAGSDGRFLVFSSYGRLTADDTDAARDVYRYDAETGVLSRVSTGEGGFDANGNNSAFNASITAGHLGGVVTRQYEMDTRAISEDGSRIVFSSAEALSPAAVNGVSNVYEWHLQPGWAEGRVSLISSGSSPESDAAGGGVGGVVISPSGRDIFFQTSQGLVPQDTDGNNDIYDARIGGGFPVAPAPRKECSGDACQGPLTNPAPLLIPGSVSQAPGENLAPPALAKPTRKSKIVSCKKGFVRNKRNKCAHKLRPKKATKASKSTGGGKS